MKNKLIEFCKVCSMISLCIMYLIIFSTMIYGEFHGELMLMSGFTAIAFVGLAILISIYYKE